MNQVFEKQSITNDFLLIREALNSKRDYLDKKILNFKEEKQKLNNFFLNERNEQVLLCKDKLYEIIDKKRTGGINEFEIDKAADLLDERIENFEKLKIDILACEDQIPKEVILFIKRINNYNKFHTV